MLSRHDGIDNYDRGMNKDDERRASYTRALPLKRTKRTLSYQNNVIAILMKNSLFWFWAGPTTLTREENVDDEEGQSSGLLHPRGIDECLLCPRHGCFEVGLRITAATNVQQ